MNDWTRIWCVKQFALQNQRLILFWESQNLIHLWSPDGYINNIRVYDLSWAGDKQAAKNLTRRFGEISLDMNNSWLVTRLISCGNT